MIRSQTAVHRKALRWAAVFYISVYVQILLLKLQNSTPPFDKIIPWDACIMVAKDYAI